MASSKRKTIRLAEIWNFTSDDCTTRRVIGERQLHGPLLATLWRAQSGRGVCGCISRSEIVTRQVYCCIDGNRNIRIRDTPTRNPSSKTLRLCNSLNMTEDRHSNVILFSPCLEKNFSVKYICMFILVKYPKKLEIYF